MFVALTLAPGQQPPRVSISLNPVAITVGQSASVSWSGLDATSCTGVGAWSGVQPASGKRDVTQNSAGTYTYTLTCTGGGGTGSASTTLTVLAPAGTATAEGVIGLPTDVTPMLTIGGAWQPISNKYIDQNTPSYGEGVIANEFAGNIRLPNGREGLVLTGWFYKGFSNPTTSITPVDIAILEQQSDGTLQVGTAKYVTDPQTNGGSNVLVADFNKDGIPDFFLPAHNEDPPLGASSTAYLSNPGGTYSKVPVGDQIAAHGATVANIQGTPTVFTALYWSLPGHGNSAIQYSPAGFIVSDAFDSGGNSSVAVADFYGDGISSLVCGDCVVGPGFPFDPSGPNFRGIQLWNLSGVRMVGNPFTVGVPYFNGKPQYSSYPSFTDPIKTHNARMWIDDFNHDGNLDVVVQGMIWDMSAGQSKNILQMYQNQGKYRFTDMTDLLYPEYDQDCVQFEFMAQARDIDGSGINSYLLGSWSWDTAKPPGNYVIVNDGSGRLHTALHETLNSYGPQIAAWLAANPALSAANYYTDGNLKPAVRAYQTADGRLNFVAIASVTKAINPSLPLWVHQWLFVNVPLQLDVTQQFTKPITVKNRNGSHLIRTFAGDDTIYAGNNGGYSKVDGGLGTNTVVYSGPSKNYSATKNSDGSWTVKDDVGADGTDTLIRIQRLQFSDSVVRLDAPPAVAYAISGNAGVAGATMTISGSLTATTTSDPVGAYSFASLPAGGNYTVTPTLLGYSFMPTSRTFVAVSATQVFNFVATKLPTTMSLDRTRLNYAARSSAVLTPLQKVLLSFSGGGRPTWTAVSNQPWLQVTPASGTGSARLTVSIVTGSLPGIGTANGTVTITAPGATNPTLTLPVFLTVLASSQPPSGSFDTPTDGAMKVVSSIPVTGWAMDDVFVTKVEIFRDPIGGERPPSGLTYIGDALFVANARPDVENQNLTRPFQYRAGWGYQMLTNTIPNASGPMGNGKIRIWAIATDAEGNTTNLGSKTLTLENTNAKLPFGAIDSPGSGATASGAAFFSNGWVLSPQPNIISAVPTNITVYVDSGPVGRVTYGQFRSDIGGIFPGYKNTNGAGASYMLDTTRYSNGIHTIEWLAIDDAGNADGIGSRYFFVENGVSAAVLETPPPVATELLETASARAARPRPGRGAAPQVMTVQEMARVVIPLPEGQWIGAHVINNEMRPLPVGSTLDNASGAFYWNLGTGFLGRHELLFTSADGAVHGVTLNIEPKSYDEKQ